ncbi:MAG: GMC family oxidoreductase, partial [Sandaracinaceae bacterium]|nr:GMC family oxidoreductase [Sandaracinaceae bacterium]
AASVPLRGARLSSLALADRTAALEVLATEPASSWLVRAVCAPLQLVRAQDPSLEGALGIPSPRSLPIARERRAGDANRVDLRALGHDEELEVDVVVVGTGAGGAPVAARLAQRGHAVVMLEEGGDFSRADFVGRPLELQKKLYRDAGLTFTIGNTLIPLPVGRTVGGTTTVNSGTCYRTPADVMRRWSVDHGLSALGPGSLDACFERVESALEIAPSPDEVLGEIARIIARGAEALGYEHGPLARNAPGCDAQAVCCFGCPTDAKRSTNVSYVPMALAAGALLHHHAKVVRILRERGRAVGVEAVSVGGDGRPVRLVVRARAVVLAAGTLYTPLVLKDNALANGSGQVGKNLSIHPAGYAFARMPEAVRGWAGVPQGYAIEELASMGIRFEGAFPPPALAAAALGSIGARWTSQVEELDKLAVFGFMVRDVSRGSVSRGPGGRPRVRYDLVPEDVRQVVRAEAVLARVFFAAGALEVMPGMSLYSSLRDLRDVERLEAEGPSRIKAHHLALTAYHPLGTCRMGADPSRYVVGPEHETHEVPGLFVCDGSAVPGPLGVNPQVTIMAMSEHAVDFVERRLEGHASTRVSVPAGASEPSSMASSTRPPRTELAFDETMAGTCRRIADGGAFEASLTVSVRADPSFRKAWEARGSVLTLEGTIRLPGLLASERPAEGTLTMRPLEGRATLIYDVTFHDERGARWSLRGEKHARFFLGLGMTRLHTEIRKEGELVASGLLRFDLRDVPSWLGTFRAIQSAA